MLPADMPYVYQFRPGPSASYKVDLHVNGFLPVMGGNEGDAEVKLTLQVKGGEPTPTGLTAIHELSDAAVFFNKTQLKMLTLKNFTDYFPKTTVNLTPAGHVLGNDAPDKKVPVRIPGLDVKRLADITYLPLEFPSAPLGVGGTWSFTKTVSGADIKYDCTVLSLKAAIVTDPMSRLAVPSPLNPDQEATIEVKVSQTMTYMENDSLEPVTDVTAAAHKVTAVTHGDGTVVFDIGHGDVTDVQMHNVTDSSVEDLSTHQVTKRSLDSLMAVDRVESAAAAVPPLNGNHASSIASNDWGFMDRFREWGFMAMNNPSVGGFVKRLLSEIFSFFNGGF